MTLKALPFVILTGFLFGSTLIASRFSVGQFHPLNYISFRLLLASSAHLLIYFFSNRSFPRDKTLWSRAALYGVFGTAVNLVGIVSALQYISSGFAAILITTSPAITAIFAHFFLPEERLNIRQWLGVLFALSGAVMLALLGENGLPDVSTTNPVGYLFAGAAILSGSVMTIYARRKLQGFDSFDTASIRMWIATLTVFPLSTIFVGYDFSAVDMQGVGAVFYAAFVGTFCGFMVQLYTITRFGAVPASMVTYIIPLVTGIGGILILGESFTPLMVVGVAIIVSGITLVQQNKRKAKTA